jgi:hypothetical protein
MDDPPVLRASAAEREAVAERLRRAGAEGRLDPAELDARLEQALAARTRAELDALVADLPPAPEPRPSAAPRGPVGPLLAQRLASWAVINAICLATWALAGAEPSFWPKWVLLGTTTALVWPLVRGRRARHLPRRPGHRRPARHLGGSRR